MTEKEAEHALDVLSCDIELRPVGAPGVGQLAGALIGVERQGAGTLVVAFAPSARRAVEAFVAAERQCCSDIQWQVEPSDSAARLRIGASPQQLDLLERMFAPA